MSRTEEDFGIVLGLAYTAFVEELRAALAAAGFDDLGRWYGYVFRALAARAMTVAELAVELDVTDQGAAKIILEMEARGYVERRPDPEDRRAKRLALAARGKAALAAARRFHHEYEKRLAARAGAARVATVRAVLTEAAGGRPRLLRPL
jgi:DNA-binding MarR family transcriptional regulator